MAALGGCRRSLRTRYRYAEHTMCSQIFREGGAYIVYRTGPPASVAPEKCYAEGPSVRTSVLPPSPQVSSISPDIASQEGT